MFFMEIIDRIPFDLDMPGLIATLKIEEGSEDEADFRELADRALTAGKPRILYSECFLGDKSEDSVAVGNVVFRSKTLRMNLDAVDKVFPHIISCGPEFDTIPLPTGDALQEYWRDCIKEAALRAAINHFYSVLARRHGLRKTASMNPGAGPADTWPIQQQKELFSLLGDVEAAIGVKLTDSFLMVPNKTISGIVFATESDFVTCSLCPRDVCRNRRAPYDQDKAESYRGG
jgi:hypothetical protein